ncbi:uncharacterized protein LOC144636335 [Oculina patagonica]
MLLTVLLTLFSIVAAASGSISPTQTALQPSSTASPSLPLNGSFQISIQLSQTAWSQDLFNKQSPLFVALATNITTAVSDVLKTVGYARVEVVEFKPGSVIAVLNVTALSSNEKTMKTRLTQEMADRQLGGFSVDPTLYSGTLVDVVLKVKFACSNSAVDKGFDKKTEFVNAISTTMSTNPDFLGANIQSIECSEADNITMVTVRLQISDLSSSNPYEELSDLKSQVDAGKVGNFSVVPELKSYIPGEKLFYVYVTLSSETADKVETRKQLERFVEDEFNGDGDFKYVHVTVPDSKTAIIEIGKSSSTSEFLTDALDPLAKDLKNAQLGNVTVVASKNRVTIDPKSLTRKIFEVSFVQYVPSCEDSDQNSLLYRNLGQGIWQFIDENIRNISISQVYVETKVIKLRCENNSTVRGFSYVYMKPNAEDNLKQFLAAFFKCKTHLNIYNKGVKITLKTPTTPDTDERWSTSLGGVGTTYICPKPKPTPAPTNLPATTPNPPPTSSPATTGSQTTETGISSTGKTSTGKTNTEPQETTEHTETTTPPTTRVTLPTMAIEPELYIKVKLGMTWGEFCSKQDTLKERIAWNVRDKNDTRVSPDRIVYVNVERNCADQSKKDELADVWFYVSEPGSKEVHKGLTLKAYEVFKMFFENGNTKQLGSDFEEKVVQVGLAGNDASEYKKETDDKMPSWVIILLAVAGAVGLFLMLLACCCLFCCGARRRRRRKYESEHPHALHVVYIDSDGSAARGAKDKGNKKSAGKDAKKSEEGKEKNTKEDGDKDGYKNDGYESDNKNKNSIDGKENCVGQGDKSPKSKAKALQDDTGNAYGSLNKTGDHTYASINKSGSGKNSDGSGDKNNNAGMAITAPVPSKGSDSSGGDGKSTKNAGYNAMTAPVPSRGSDSSEGDGKSTKNAGYNAMTAPVPTGGSFSSAGGDDKSKDGGSSSSDINSARDVSGGESQNSASQPSTASLMKADASPKGGRRGSHVYSSIDDDVPLTHKTGTVGIVALAIRNKNETKKEREFKNLNKDVPNEEVKYPPDTGSKNRYPDVLPAPRSRVKLSSSPDYINANWIRDHKGQICYIATQHPLRETAQDFWRMVWDQKAHTVVMVNIEEKEKPAEFIDYLPKEHGSTKQFGSIDVTVKQITEKPDYILTILSIVEGKNTASAREVSHIKFTSWKERAMPNVALFVGFVSATREARKKYADSKAPTIVHCSDGLGFTGVYIAVDIGIKSHEESKTSVVDVFELSKNLRRDRHGIVCTLEHYNFIYQALYEYTVNYNKSVE